MKTKVKNVSAALVASYWFVPGIMCAVAAFSALGVLAYDYGDHGGGPRPMQEWVNVNTSEGARQLLATIAGSTITLAGVIFSITILALSFASSHFGPRVLHSFMRDWPGKVVLGAFVSTYLYCLLVLRTIRSEPDDYQVPHTAIAGALLLGVASVGLLVFFIHHVASSLQAASNRAGYGRVER